MATQRIRYQEGKGLDLDQVIALYRSSTLGERRPIDDRECMRQMIESADLIICAWDAERLVGIARTLTDFCYVAYLSDLAVDAEFQRQGIGKELIRQTRLSLGPQTLMVLLAAPAAEGYYGRIGFTQHHSAWILPAQDDLTE
jgi:ribosomal protein S18 acetylase RimI-like enzyme